MPYLETRRAAPYSRPRVEVGLGNERKAAGYAQQFMKGGEIARVGLRRLIRTYLARHGPQTSPVMRRITLKQAGLDPASRSAVNIHAWALVDLQRAGEVKVLAMRNGDKLYALVTKEA